MMITFIKEILLSPIRIVSLIRRLVYSRTSGSQIYYAKRDEYHININVNRSTNDKLD